MDNLKKEAYSLAKKYKEISDKIKTLELEKEALKVEVASAILDATKNKPEHSLYFKDFGVNAALCNKNTIKPNIVAKVKKIPELSKSIIESVDPKVLLTLLIEANSKIEDEKDKFDISDFYKVSKYYRIEFYDGLGNI